MKYSGKQITKAGNNFLSDEIMSVPIHFSHTLDVLSYWRSCHTVPLENALEKLRIVTKSIDKNALYAKRLKRYPSIQLKLRRFPKMSLKNMQDIGGCRVIVANSKKVEQVVRALRTKPEFKTSNGGAIKYKDYIKSPKDDGYRSYHIIGNFLDENDKSHKIEIQVRTKIQHYWATALEIVDLFTRQSLKTNQGNKTWSEFFISLSDQFAAMDEVHLFHESNKITRLKSYASKLVTNPDLASKSIDVVILSKQLDVINKLNAFANSLQIVDKALQEIQISGYVLLQIDLYKKTLSYEVFSQDDSKNAEIKYTESEKLSASSLNRVVVALVYTDHLNEIKQAYPNFFADSTEFIELLNIIHKSENIFKKSIFEKIISTANLKNY